MHYIWRTFTLKALSAVVLWMLPFSAYASDLILNSGHNSQNFGATSCSGRKEYEYNRELSSAVEKYLESKGKSVTLTTGSNLSNQSLKYIDGLKTEHKLFLSIHHDSVQPQFVIKDKKTGGYCSDKASGFSLFVSTKNPKYGQSLFYAQRLGEALLRLGFKPTLHHAEQIPGESRVLIDSKLGIYVFDDLFVLKNNNIPAVLFEAAVIVNPVDEQRALSKDFKNQISEAIYEMLGAP
jgi:N-acetylmuramoyl-L-alanine amidase